MGKSDRPAAAALPEDFGLTDVEPLTMVRRFVDQLRTLRDDIVLKDAADQVVSRGMGIMTAYLAGELPREAAAVLEKDLLGDPIFRALFAPVLAAWRTPNVEREVAPEEVDAAFARFKARTAARRDGH